MELEKRRVISEKLLSAVVINTFFLLLIFRMDGATSINERQALTKTFSVDPDVSVFLLSTKAAGVGLNLTAADSVILMDQVLRISKHASMYSFFFKQDWNPHNDRQAEDRVHRIGQTRPVTIYRLCCQDTLEETIIEVAHSTREQSV